VDEEGNPLVVYHGANRSDKIGADFDPEKATSGPSAYFTDDPVIASNYAKNKRDTSSDEFFSEMDNWFMVEGRPLAKAWWRLSREKRREIAEKLPHVINPSYLGEDPDPNSPMVGEYQISPTDYGLSGKDHWDWTIRSQRGNVLAAAREIWLNGGNLVGSEEEFVDILNLAGLKDVKFDSPRLERPGVVPVYLSIKNPLDGANVPSSVVKALNVAAGTAPAPKWPDGVDIWDKDAMKPEVWIDQFNEGLDKEHNIAWTSIPDWVTETLRGEGYDGIRDRGGKMGGSGHTVWIPFDDGQIKNALTGETMEESLTEHEPGGQGHDQDLHGNWARGGGKGKGGKRRRLTAASTRPEHSSFIKMKHEIIGRIKVTPEEGGAVSMEARPEDIAAVKKYVEKMEIKLGVDMWEEWGNYGKDVIPGLRSAELLAILADQPKGFLEQIKGRMAVRVEKKSEAPTFTVGDQMFRMGGSCSYDYDKVPVMPPVDDYGRPQGPVTDASYPDRTTITVYDSEGEGLGFKAAEVYLHELGHAALSLALVERALTGDGYVQDRIREFDKATRGMPGSPGKGHTKYAQAYIDEYLETVANDEYDKQLQHTFWGEPLKKRLPGEQRVVKSKSITLAAGENFAEMYESVMLARNSEARRKIVDKMKHHTPQTARLFADLLEVLDKPAPKRLDLSVTGGKVR
jgi:hypothetical protein